MHDTQWVLGYTPNQNWKTTKQIVHHLADIVSKGGNFLLNVGPDGQGVLSKNYGLRLDSIGLLMKANGESIYGCHSSNLPQPKWGRITAKGNKAYLHVFDWPADGKLLTERLNKKISNIYLLNNKIKLKYKLSSEGLKLMLPVKMPDKINTVVVLEL